MPYIPTKKIPAAANIDRLQRDRRLASGSECKDGSLSQAYSMAVIVEFHVIREKVESMQEESSLTDNVNKMMGDYQVDSAGYRFTTSHKYAYHMAPFQVKQLLKANMFADITSTGK